MDTDNTNDSAAMSPASAGSHNTDMATARLSAANTWLQDEIRRLRLTAEEREAVEVAAQAYADDHGERFAATLRGLLHRTH